MKKIFKSIWILAALGEFEWYRKFYKGKWARVYVEDPVHSVLWLNLPPDSDETYREGNWRGNPTFVDYGQ